jgi:cobyrinic acid a,c-diamide synthase
LAKGFIIAAPRSGSGKTLVTLGLIAVLKARGVTVAPAKTGPDYIDAAILSRVAHHDAVNLDPWAMSPDRLQSIAANQAGDGLLVVEGVMGLFDGAADGRGSTGDLAEILQLPVILVVDAERQSQSVAPLVAGFANWRPGVKVAGLILNRVATIRHETMLRRALAETGIPVLGVLPRREALHLPERHLGLVLPDELITFDAVVAAAQAAVGEYIHLDRLLALATLLPSSPLRGATEGGGRSVVHRWTPTPSPSPHGGGERDLHTGLTPLGQHIAVARDDAFSFLYPHWLSDWRAAGAELSFFSPLANEGPRAEADAVFLPGGYPELHGAKLALAHTFRAGMLAARDRGALIYGECGGFMVLGRSLTDKGGATHRMLGLLDNETTIERPKRTLGYRRLVHKSPLPWPERLYGHEFHYSTGTTAPDNPLFHATDAQGEPQPPLGAIHGRVVGSYAHVIDAACATAL